MTGGTLIIRSGSIYYLTKVAHDGDDLSEDREKIEEWVASAKDPKEVIKNFFSFRKEKWSPQSEFSSIDFSDDYDPIDKDFDLCVFSKTLETKDFEEALSEMEESINQEISKMEEDEDNDLDIGEHPYMQLGCSYTDCGCYIDFDTKTVNVYPDDLEDEG